MIDSRYIEFQASVLRQMPRPEEFGETTLDGWNNNPKALKEALAKVLLPASDVSALLRDWEKFYQNIFGITVGLSKVKIPERKKGYGRLVVVAQGMTPQRLYDKCKELFPCWKYASDNLDKIIQSERTARNGAYAVWFRDIVEADEDLKNLSADDLKEKGILGSTLEERFLMELKYFKEGGHLDIEKITLCSGSRYADGGVPSVHWNSDELNVGRYNPARRYDDLRSRRAV